MEKYLLLNSKDNKVDNKPKLFVYINVFAALVADKSESIQKYISEHLNADSWKSYSNDLNKMKDVLTPDIDVESFFDGFSMQQYLEIGNDTNGGIYINPMYSGLVYNRDKWSSYINNDDFNQTFLYLDVPYDIYIQNFEGEEPPVNQDTYQTQSDNLKKIIEELYGEQPKRLH